jgi:hypothetical protein
MEGGKTTCCAMLGEIVPPPRKPQSAGRWHGAPDRRSRLDYPVSALDVALMGSLGRLLVAQAGAGGTRRGARSARAWGSSRPRTRPSRLSGDSASACSSRARAGGRRAAPRRPFSGLATDAGGLKALIDDLAGAGAPC